MRKVLSDLIRMHTCGKPASAPAESELAESHPGKEKKDAWEVVEASRKADRLTALDYIEGIFTDFLELHGDRYFKDDGSIVGGIAMLGDTPVTGDRPAKGEKSEGKSGEKFRHAFSGRISQGAEADETGGEIPPPGYLLRGYAGSLLRHGCGRKRPGTGYCGQPV